MQQINSPSTNSILHSLDQEHIHSTSCSGQSEIPLNVTGREQAKALGRSLLPKDKSRPNSCFSHVFSSDLDRALDTAKLILTNADQTERLVDIRTDQRLRERGYG